MLQTTETRKRKWDMFLRLLEKSEEKRKVKIEILKSFHRRGLRVYRNLLQNNRYICGIKYIPESTPVKYLE